MVDGSSAPRAERGGPSKSGELKLFISYSRKDLDFAEQLVAALETLDHAVVIDRRGIHGAERWEARLGQMILESDTVVFVLSRASASSSVCRWEIDQALERRKRIVPVLAEPLDATTQPHEALRDLNYIHFYPDPSFPGSGWGGGLARLQATLAVDIEWIREHTRVFEMAVRWQAADGGEDLLARGSELGNLARWRDARPVDAPEITSTQRAFLQASEEAEARRLDVERRHIEQVRAAQEARAVALQATATAQEERAKALTIVLRRTIAGIVVAALLTIGVGIAAFLAYRNGEQARTALRQIEDERSLQDRLIQLARRRDSPGPPYAEDVLARRYEGETTDHVGTDFLGGVYYGIFRIKAGPQMDEFLGFLRRYAGALFEPLATAGGSAAALRQDPRFVAAWRALGTAPETADLFAAKQADFIKLNDYGRLVARLASPSPVEGDRDAAVAIDVRKRSIALRAVIYSIAVQYGPGTRLVNDAFRDLGDLSKRQDRELISQLYRFRDDVDRYFPDIESRSPNFAALIRERNQWELNDALYILDHEPRT